MRKKKQLEPTNLQKLFDDIDAGNAPEVDDAETFGSTDVDQNQYDSLLDFCDVVAEEQDSAEEKMFVVFLQDDETLNARAITFKYIEDVLDVMNRYELYKTSHVIEGIYKVRIEKIELCVEKIERFVLKVEDEDGV